MLTIPSQESPPIIKVLLVDDRRVVREKIKSVLQSCPDIQVVGIAADGDSALEQLDNLDPDTILIDLDMPGLDGIQTAKIISQQYPHIQVIIVSSLENTPDVSTQLAPCVKDYIIKADIELEIANKIRAAHQDRDLTAKSKRDNVVGLNRFDRQIGEYSSTDVDGNLSKFTNVSQTTLSKLHDWSNSARELIDMMPLPWTRGLLYSLLLFLGIIIPWACLYRMDEIGTARGRLESKGNTIKREADIEGSVSVLKVYVKKGDRVKAGQIIMALDAKSVREQIYQNQLKLNGSQQQYDRLLAIKSQVGLGTNAQQQQNQAQLLEKQALIAQAQQVISNLESNAQTQIAEKLAQLRQAQQTLIDRQSSSNLQKAEKLTQVRQAEQAIVDAQTNYILAQNRFKDAQNEEKRYQKLYQTGAISEVKAKEVASLSLEKKQLFTQALASLTQSKLRATEQRENYQKLLQQSRADIEQANLRLAEQQQIYQGTIARTQSDIAQAKLRFTEQQRGYQSLTKGGNIAVLKTEQQSKEIQSQIATLQSEIARDRAQGNFLTQQLQKYTIHANTDGTIFELPIDREGAVVQPKQLLAEIAADTSGLVFKGEIPATESESLRTSTIQKEVKLKFDEFPFESYDVVKGKLSWIAPNSKLSQTPQGSRVANYEIEVQLGQSCIRHEQKCIPFKSGQPATAEIVIRNRRIIDFLLDPFKKLSSGDR
ncbi:response regulator [Chamaesiphon sp. OTE_8_metabat_110]|uniref:response regulator n=1 Tax=Chamaesiphon sp. OTE_8_metabat_110 TaxID=2964696 RepID=UPI00286D681B|nr:response regulator [Chamaesiphon sp. OTE_8_metabat_110]